MTGRVATSGSRAGRSAPPEGPPGESERARLSAAAERAFRALASPYPGTWAEWKRYGAKSGWVLKVGIGKRTLLYLRPHAGQLTATVVLGDRAVAAALASRLPEGLKGAIRAARRYVEGRPIPVVVKGPREVGHVMRLLDAKREPAAGSSRSAG